MAKVDLQKDLKSLSAASREAPALVEVPHFSYLMADGHGDPNTVPAFQQAVETLVKLSYVLKCFVKKEMGLDVAAMPLKAQRR
jgi:hypothetical protein